MQAITSAVLPLERGLARAGERRGRGVWVVRAVLVSVSL
jgi:hypothetical protein